MNFWFRYHVDVKEMDDARISFMSGVIGVQNGDQIVPKSALYIYEAVLRSG